MNVIGGVTERVVTNRDVRHYEWQEVKSRCEKDWYWEELKNFRLIELEEVRIEESLRLLKYLVYYIGRWIEISEI